MTLVLITPTFPKLSESFLVSKFLALLDAGWDVHVVCQQSPSSAWRQIPSLRDRPQLRRRVHRGWPHRPRLLAAGLLPAAVVRCLLRTPRATLAYLRRLGHGGLRRLYLDAEIAVLRPRLIHFEFGALAPGREDLGELLDARLVVSFRGYDLNRVGLEDPEHYAEVWRRADALHFLGRDLRRRALERGCPARRKHALIPPALDPELFDPGQRRHRDAAGSEDRPLRVLSVGRLEWEKGYDYSLAALRLLEDRGLACEMRIVGDGSQLAAVAFARHQLGLSGVELLGARDADAVREEMRRADVFLHLAVSEGFGNAVVEAQAMALPVVASDAGGLPENVRDGDTGFIVPRRDPAAAAERLSELARDPALRQRMGEAGRRRAVEHFQLADQAKSFDRLYRELLQPEAAGAVDADG